jgi:hypothetical protein
VLSLGAQVKIRPCFRPRRKSSWSMSVDLMLPAGEKITPVLEGIGDDKIRVNSSSLARPSARNRGDREEGHGGAHGALGLLAER